MEKYWVSSSFIDKLLSLFGNTSFGGDINLFDAQSFKSVILGKNKNRSFSISDRENEPLIINEL